MNTKNFLRSATLAILFVSIFSSCKKEYEAPPVSEDPNLTVTTTIAQLKAKHTVSGTFDVIDSNLIISGIVIANDKSGNIYKEIYIRDASGAIAVELASTGLYANFPVGRRVFIKLKGMCLSDTKNMIQLGLKLYSNGTPSLSAVPAPLISNYIIGGSLGHFAEAAPKPVTAADLGLSSNPMQTPLVGDLVKLSDYEFQLSDTKRSYADTSNNKSTLQSMVYIKNCNGDGPFIVLTSGYADFAAKAPQAGNGDISALFTIYGTTKQFVIRDTTDVKFTNPRCYLFEEDFSSLTTADNKTTFAFPGWQNIAEVGTVKFANAVFGTSGKCILANAFASGSAVAKAWAITPSIYLPAGISPKLSFTTAYRFATGPTTLKVYISKDYAGSQTPWTSTWQELTPPTPIAANTATNNSSTFTSFVSSGNIDLSTYSTGQKVYIAFVYEGGDPGKTTVIELDDVKIASR